jgi:hypothetical protein
MRATLRSRHAFALAGLTGGLCALGACLTFDGVTLPLLGDAGALPDRSVGTDAPITSDAGSEVRPTPDACANPATGYLSLSEAAKACQYIFECDTGQLELDIESNFGIVTSASSYAYCVNALSGTVPSDRAGLIIAQQTFKCVAKATSCIQARGCLAIESLTAKDSRCADGGPKKNDAGIYCGNGGNDIFDCANGVAVHCKTPTFGNSSCIIDPGDPAYYSCGILTTPKCATEVTSCDIATATLNDCPATTSVTSIDDCTVFGGTCGATGKDGGPANGCLTDGKYDPCDTLTYRDQCEGDSIASCTYIGTVAHTNCKSIGKTCNATNAAPFCIGPNDECTPFSLGIGECTGNSILLCIDGKKTPFDCGCAGLVCGADAGIGKTHCAAPP